MSIASQGALKTFVPSSPRSARHLAAALAIIKSPGCLVETSRPAHPCACGAGEPFPQWSSRLCAACLENPCSRHSLSAAAAPNCAPATTSRKGCPQLMRHLGSVGNLAASTQGNHVPSLCAPPRHYLIKLPVHTNINTAV
jgi:hypothetical protein